MWNRNVKIGVLLLVFYVVYAEARISTPSSNGLEDLEPTNHALRSESHRKSSAHHFAAKHRHQSTKPRRRRRLQTLRAQLTKDQRRRFFHVMRKDEKVTKKVHKSKLIKRFVKKLTGKQQKHIEIKHRHALKLHKKRQKLIAKKLKKLSPKARSLFGRFSKIANNDSITKPVEQKQIRKTLKSANKSVLRELKKARVELPGVMSHQSKRRRRHVLAQKHKSKRTKLHKSKHRSARHHH